MTESVPSAVIAHDVDEAHHRAAHHCGDHGRRRRQLRRCQLLARRRRPPRLQPLQRRIEQLQ
jgi:hypothetical protein